MNAYIFLCTNETEQECFDRKLLGGTKSYVSKVNTVNPGDLLFLYNIQSHTLFGIFSATSKAKMNIIKTAWKGEFPWQVRYKEEEKAKPLAKTELVDILSFGRAGFPASKVKPEKLTDLLALFKSTARISKEESDFRRENPSNIKTIDGHFVRSHAERKIDNWLYENRIVHAYEITVPVKEYMTCDFYVPSASGGVYIEYWGLEDQKYKSRKEKKKIIYKRNKLNLLELTQKNLRDLDSKLRSLVSK